MACRVTRDRERLMRDAAWLHQKYIVEELSTRQIANLIGVDGSSIAYWMKKFGIPARHEGFNVKEKSGHWKGGKCQVTQVKYARLELKQECEDCGATEKLHIHHKDKNRNNNSLENLQVLCPSCHVLKHVKDRKKRVNFPPRDNLGRFTKEEMYHAY